MVDTSLADGIVGTRDSLLQFFSRATNHSNDELFANDHRKPKLYLSDEKALEVFMSTSNLASTSEVNSLNKVQRNQLVRDLRDKGLTVKQIARLLDISVTTVKRLSKKSP